MKLARFFLTLLAALVVMPAASHADERILDYASDIQIQKDGTLVVQESIRVRAEGNLIRHGIFRDLPTIRGSSFWRSNHVGFELLGVERDGSTEPAATENIQGGIRVRIGDPNNYVPAGEHVYVIRYSTTNQIGRFKDFDELYWNVTGSGWIFPIDHAETTVTLPEPTTLGNRSFYTGPQGAQGKDAEIVSEEAGRISFRTTAPLAEREGLTIAVAWPKGVVADLPQATRTRWLIADVAPPVLASIGLAGLLAYYFYAWLKAGRGPRPGTIVPIFAPPDDLSAAAMRYVTRMGSDNRTFAAALVELGVRGHLRLVEGEKHLFSNPKTTIERQPGTQAIPDPERAMLERLFEGGDSIVMEQKNHAIFEAAQKKLSSGLKAAYEGKLFVRNLGWATEGLVLLFAVLWITAAATLLGAAMAPHLTQMVLLGPVAFVGSYILFKSFRPESWGARVLVYLVASLLALAALAAGGATIGTAFQLGPIAPLIIPLLSLPFVLSAFAWMAAPTKNGRAVLDHIAGFKQYLSITEEDRLDRMHPPEKTPELFEKYLPYAIALKVENHWADRFQGVLAAAAASGHSNNSFLWYSGNSNPWSNPTSFVDTVGSTLSSTVASASSAPGSSGGGSSGGGGGGGGGGGW